MKQKYKIIAKVPFTDVSDLFFHVFGHTRMFQNRTPMLHTGGKAFVIRVRWLAFPVRLTAAELSDKKICHVFACAKTVADLHYESKLREKPLLHRG